MKRLTTLTMLLLIGITACTNNKGIIAYLNNGVEQSIVVSTGTNVVCSNCEIELQTLVWYNQRIYKSWFDNFDKTDTALAKKRILQGDSILRIIKKIND